MELCINEKRKGFTLAELLIVVAIIAVLVAIAIPMFNKQLEKSREAADLANVRTAYAEVMTEVILGNVDKRVYVKLKQQIKDWQSWDPVTIGDVTHYKSEGDTDQWIGVPEPKGTCEVYLDQDNFDIVFKWSGTGGEASYDFNIRENLFDALNDSKLLERDELKKNNNFEFDSRCPESSYVPEIEKTIKENSLLKNGTWAYWGSGKEETKRYLAWTSFNTNEVGAGKKIPVIMQTSNGKYYITETTTGSRTVKEKEYVAISQHLTPGDYVNLINSSKQNGQEYNTLKEAYDAYQKVLKEEKYSYLKK